MQAQTHRFIYEVQNKKDSIESNLNKEIYHLDIEGNNVYYYNRIAFVMDSLMTQKAEINSESVNPTESMYDFVLHQRGSSQYENYEMLEFDMLKLTTEVQQDWKITGEQGKYQNFTIQKATTNWGGRKWTAWFTTDIPFPEGPHKFHGLPGMIMELRDDKGNYRFKLVKSERFDKSQDHKFIMFWAKKAVPVNQEKYLKTKLNFYKDPLSFINNGKIDLSGGRKAGLKDGTIVSQENMREVIANQQKKLIKYNNPIELDKAIRYE